MAALLGTLTPFCSCSSIPLFIGFTSAGLPLSVTFAFLISSPLVDLASVILLASIFYWSIALSDVAAAQETGAQVEIEKLTDIETISGFGVMPTPGLVIDGKVVSSGRVLTMPQITEILAKV
jgi:hypothetical protein